MAVTSLDLLSMEFLHGCSPLFLVAAGATALYGATRIFQALCINWKVGYNLVVRFRHNLTIVLSFATYPL